jgi:hypothetical protein
MESNFKSPEAPEPEPGSKPTAKANLKTLPLAEMEKIFGVVGGWPNITLALWLPPCRDREGLIPPVVAAPGATMPPPGSCRLRRRSCFATRLGSA